MFDWDDARFFLAIARAGSVSGAGRSLRVQQSTVSRRLAGLEDCLGARLFERTPDGYILTPAGESLHTRAERMEEEAQAAERELLGRESQVAGVVRLTTPEAFGNGLMPALLARLRLEQPDILVELVAANARLSLTKREADLAIRTGRPQQALLVMRKLGELVDALYASKAYLDQRGRPSGPDLGTHDYVDYDDTYAGGSETAWLRQVARNARCVLRVTGTHGMFGAIQAGLGVGVLPCWMGDATDGLERVLPTERYTSELCMVLHRDLRHVARIRAVAEFLTRALRADAARLAGRPERRSRKVS
jgi:DNA-binding transcriptional LysR family regulator